MIVILGVTMRWLCTFLVTSIERKFTTRERAFISFAWIPKATVQAALSTHVLSLAETDEHKRYGEIILTTAIIAILISAPTGAILISGAERTWQKVAAKIKKLNNSKIQIFIYYSMVYF